MFGALTALGLLLANRVDNLIPLIVLIVAGAYAGWLLGVIVFGALRGNEEGNG